MKRVFVLLMVALMSTLMVNAKTVRGVFACFSSWEKLYLWEISNKYNYYAGTRRQIHLRRGEGGG